MSYYLLKVPLFPFVQQSYQEEFNRTSRYLNIRYLRKGNHCFCDEEDSGLSDEEQERKGPKNRPKHTRKRIHQDKKNFLEKFKTASKLSANIFLKKMSECLWLY